MVIATREIVEELQEGLTNAEPGRIEEVLAADAILDLSGRTGLSGPYRGREAILGLMRKLWELSGGSFRFHGERALVEGGLAVVLGHIAWDRGHRRRTAPAVLTVAIRGKEVVQLRIYYDDQPIVDELCS